MRGRQQPRMPQGKRPDGLVRGTYRDLLLAVTRLHAIGESETLRIPSPYFCACRISLGEISADFDGENRANRLGHLQATGSDAIRPLRSNEMAPRIADVGGRSAYRLSAESPRGRPGQRPTTDCSSRRESPPAPRTWPAPPPTRTHRILRCS